MAAGRIKIYRIVMEQTGARKEERDPVLHHEAWCDVADLYGQELYDALNVKLEDTASFKIRYCKKVREVMKSMKDYFIEYEEDRFEIYAKSFFRNEKQYVIFKCKKIS